MNPLDLFNSLGWVFGPLVLLAGIYALVICNWADSPRWAWRAVICSCMPFVLGVIAALWGLNLILEAGQQAGDRGMSWYYLGKTCLAGLVVTLPPLVWSLLLLRSRAGRRPDVAGSN
jgi:hypothetical protein